MEYNAKMLFEKIEDYLAGAISKNSLGEWANSAYYDLLKGGYVENEKIVIYPFIKEMSTFHLRENDKDDFYPCTEENVKMIQEILHGKKNFDFTVEMSFPVQALISYLDCYIGNRNFQLLIAYKEGKSNIFIAV